ncbi:DEAD/DEAH box helicase [bacterium]|nr:DEAD/DEAH box helicase [candidate division CSSED10-310 bacterium]
MTTSRIDEILSTLTGSSRKSRWITAFRRIPGAAALWVDLPGDLHPELVRAMESLNIRKLYSHQAEAFHAVRNDRDTVIVTPTASGKTWCYNLPVLDGLLKNPARRAVYVFPTKALCHDQLHELQRINRKLAHPVHAATYDGDTPSGSRQQIRKSVQILLTNPDMLHTAVLPHHTKWQQMLGQLDAVVIDELHHYRGVFGSHLGNVIRRLLRICTFYGSNPRFILCSATLANPRELAEAVTGRSVHLINRSGAPSGERNFLLYNPPVIDPEKWIRRSYLAEAVEIARIFLEGGAQTIVFARTRLNVEILLKELRRAMKEMPEGAVRGYRGGYLPVERREIESGLREGTIRCVVATSALELGVDIGNLETAILAGYPGTIASTWQRAGRAGRREGGSATVLIASSAPLDQFIVRNPDYFFGSGVEHGLINPNNLLILLEHIRCAAFELPFAPTELFGDRPETREILEFLEEEGDVINTAGRWHYSGGTYPAASVSLRSISSTRYRIVDSSGGAPVLIEEIDAVSVPFLLHPEAVFLHEDKQYLVHGIDPENLTVSVVSTRTDYFTVPVEQSSVLVVETAASSDDLYPAHYGELEVCSKVVGYRRLKFHTMENVGGAAVDLPENRYRTAGFWITYPVDPENLENKQRFEELVDALAGGLSAMHSVSSVLLMSEPGDLGTWLSGGRGRWTVQRSYLGSIDIQVPESLRTAHPEIDFVIFDRHPGGVGLSEQLFVLFGALIDAAVRLVEECPCRTGCPACVGPVYLKKSLVKNRAVQVLKRIQQGIRR